MVRLGVDRRSLPRAVFVESSAQRFGHLWLSHPLQIRALQHEDLHAILEKTDAWRGRRVVAHVAPRSFDSVAIDSGKHRDRSIRNDPVLKRQHDTRPSLTGGTAADGVHNDECGSSFRLQNLVDLFRCGERFDADSSQFLPEGFDSFWIVDGRERHHGSLRARLAANSGGTHERAARRQSRTFTDSFDPWRVRVPSHRLSCHSERSLPNGQPSLSCS